MENVGFNGPDPYEEVLTPAAKSGLLQILAG